MGSNPSPPILKPPTHPLTMPTLLDALYAFLALLAAPVILRKDRDDWPARRGHGDPLPPPRRPRVLLCAVSVGEVNLLRALVPRLAESCDVVIASTTDTGFARARELFAPAHHVVRYPIDFSWCVRRFLRRVRPDAVALVELELWPQFLAACAARRVPVCVINGRLSDRSAPRYRRARPITGRWFRRLAFVAAQDDRSAQRFREAGAREVRVAGNMKWDAAPGSTDQAAANEFVSRLGLDRTRPVVVAGSTAPGEPELLVSALPEGTQLIVAPRRPEWFDAAAAALPRAARWSDPPPPGTPPTRFFLLDVIGKLTDAYALADVAVIGRSFGDLHGSDPMEPASLGVPALIGPAHADFLEPVTALTRAGALRVVTPQELAPALAALVSDPGAREAMAAGAASAAAALRGATERTADMIRELLPTRPSVP